MTTVGGLVGDGGDPPPTGPPAASEGVGVPPVPPREPVGPGGVGAAAREERAAALDAWLAGLFQAAVQRLQSLGG